MSRSAPRLTPQRATRLGVRVLDRPTVPERGGRPGSQATAYVGRCLLVTGRPADRRDDIVKRLATAAEPGEVGVEVNEHHDPVAESLAAMHPLAADIVDRYWVSRVLLSPAQHAQHEPRPAVDAWPVLQRLRREGFGADEVRLDHPAFACAFNGATSRVGGGRRPVSLTLPDPATTTGRRRRRRPVVVVPDTGTGEHPWFRDPSTATHEVTVGELSLGLGGPMDESSATTRDVLDGSLLPYAGHGTFIAGLVRQQCPQARIEGIRVMKDDGVVDEQLFLNTLVALLVRQVVAVSERRSRDAFDVLSLSLGYYHEEPGDERTDPVLAGLLRELGSWGVAVVAAAGNDGTTAPFHPASFAGRTAGEQPASVVPLTSVGALNPNGTVAYFSNDGPWVSCKRPGVDLVSTVPPLQGTAQPSRHSTFGGRERSAVDPDDYTGGFATWSGTSFAAPLLAGQIAAWLARSRSIDATDRRTSVRRGRAAVSHAVAAA